MAFTHPKPRGKRSLWAKANTHLTILGKSIPKEARPIITYATSVALSTVLATASSILLVMYQADKNNSAWKNQHDLEFEQKILSEKIKIMNETAEIFSNHLEMELQACREENEEITINSFFMMLPKPPPIKGINLEKMNTSRETMAKKSQYRQEKRRDLNSKINRSMTSLFIYFDEKTSDKLESLMHEAECIVDNMKKIEESNKLWVNIFNIPNIDESIKNIDLLITQISSKIDHEDDERDRKVKSLYTALFKEMKENISQDWRPKQALNK